MCLFSISKCQQDPHHSYTKSFFKNLLSSNMFFVWSFCASSWVTTKKHEWASLESTTCKANHVHQSLSKQGVTFFESSLLFLWACDICSVIISFTVCYSFSVITVNFSPNQKLSMYKTCVVFLPLCLKEINPGKHWHIYEDSCRRLHGFCWHFVTYLGCHCHLSVCEKA